GACGSALGARGASPPLFLSVIGIQHPCVGHSVYAQPFNPTVGPLYTSCGEIQSRSRHLRAPRGESARYGPGSTSPNAGFAKLVGCRAVKERRWQTTLSDSFTSSTAANRKTGSKRMKALGKPKVA